MKCKGIIATLIVILMMLSITICATAETTESTEWVCINCGNTATGNFCNNCGSPKNSWKCLNCGTLATGNFCNNCGTARPTERVTTEIPTVVPTSTPKPVSMPQWGEETHQLKSGTYIVGADIPVGTFHFWKIPGDDYTSVLNVYNANDLKKKVDSASADENGCVLNLRKR